MLGDLEPYVEVFQRELQVVRSRDNEVRDSTNRQVLTGGHTRNLLSDGDAGGQASLRVFPSAGPCGRFA